jgi:transcriptional antiterminator RfaH
MTVVGRVNIHPSCGSHGGLRWYCAAAAPRREVDARDALEDAGFAAFLPLVAVTIRHARKERVEQRAVFPGYLFVALDVSRPGWRLAAHTKGIRRLFGSTPERPTPLPIGLVERMLAVGFDQPIVADVTPALIAAGADVRITDGPMLDHRGICQWDDGTRCRVLLSILGREIEVVLKRGQVEPAA